MTSPSPDLSDGPCIQKHAHLLCCDIRDWRISCFSEGLASVLDVGEQTLLGRPLPELLCQAEFRRWVDALHVSAHDRATRVLHGQRLSDDGREYDLSFLLIGERAFIEIELRRTPLIAVAETGYLAAITAKLMRLDDQVSVIKLIREEVKLLTGFDRCIWLGADEHALPMRAPSDTPARVPEGEPSRWIADAQATCRELRGDLPDCSAWISLLATRIATNAERDWLASQAGAQSMFAITISASRTTRGTLVALNSIASPLGGELRALVQQLGLLAGLRLHSLGT